MFPESFVERHLAWSEPGDVVLDPFSGRGTTVFTSLLRSRNAIAGDTNPVAFCVSRAKANPPQLKPLLKRIAHLKDQWREGASQRSEECETEFFRLCYSRTTLDQLLFLRRKLRWRARRVDGMIAALALGCLHGESHRTELCFSNRMPRTISTKPAYSIRWWLAKDSLPPTRDVFKILSRVAEYRYMSPLPRLRGQVVQEDARTLASRLPEAKGRVSLVITSPPYLDTTNYGEDQWLRLWFLGGGPRPKRASTDDRHRSEHAYWQFLKEAWRGVGPLLKDGAHVVVRIGGRAIDAQTVEVELPKSLREGLGGSVRLRDRHSSRIVRSQIQSFRPGSARAAIEHDFHFQIG